jgi:hypothetical protein
MLYGVPRRGVTAALKIRGSSDRTFTNEPLFSWFLGAAQRNVRLTPFIPPPRRLAGSSAWQIFHPAW